MDDREFRAIKARIAYKDYVSQLPKCDQCEDVLLVKDRKRVRRVCLRTQEVIDERIETCPHNCPKRK